MDYANKKYCLIRRVDHRKMGDLTQGIRTIIFDTNSIRSEGKPLDDFVIQLSSTYIPMALIESYYQSRVRDPFDLLKLLEQIYLPYESQEHSQLAGMGTEKYIKLVDEQLQFVENKIKLLPKMELLTFLKKSQVIETSQNQLLESTEEALLYWSAFLDKPISADNLRVIQKKTELIKQIENYVIDLSNFKKENKVEDFLTFLPQQYDLQEFTKRYELRK